MVVFVVMVATVIAPAVLTFPFEIAPGVLGLAAALSVMLDFLIQLLLGLTNALFAIICCQRRHNAANEQKSTEYDGA
jgi:membrane protein implicated in regulation of membrane protease activity